MLPEIKLLPCPFCRGKAEFRDYLTSEYVRCTECGASTNYFGEHQDNSYLNQILAAQAWNRRDDNVVPGYGYTDAYDELCPRNLNRSCYQCPCYYCGEDCNYCTIGWDNPNCKSYGKDVSDLDI